MSNVKISQSYLKFFLRRHALLWFFTWRHINLFWKHSGYLCPLLREYFFAAQCSSWLCTSCFCVSYECICLYLFLVYVYLQLRVIQTIKIWYMIYKTYKWYISDVANMHFFRDFLPVKKLIKLYFEIISYQVKLPISILLFFFIFNILSPSTIHPVDQH